MGVAIMSFDDFQNKLKAIKIPPKLLVLFLYFSTEKDKVLSDIATDNESWIDETARRTGTYFFYPSRKSGEEYENPSPEICRIFKIKPIDLPGILIFAPPSENDRFDRQKAVFFPVASRYNIDSGAIQNSLYELSELIQEALEKSKDKEVNLSEFREHLEDLRKKQNRGYFFDYLRQGVKSFFIEVPKFIGRESLNALVKASVSTK
jgi:hypothetical protein